MSKKKIYGFCKYDMTGNCKYAGNKHYGYGFLSGMAEYCRYKKEWVCDLKECPLKKELVSNCCSAPVLEYDYCSKCGEPCAIVETE